MPMSGLNMLKQDQRVRTLELEVLAMKNTIRNQESVGQLHCVKNAKTISEDFDSIVDAYFKSHALKRSVQTEGLVGEEDKFKTMFAVEEDWFRAIWAAVPRSDITQDKKDQLLSQFEVVATSTQKKINQMRAALVQKLEGISEDLDQKSSKRRFQPTQDTDHRSLRKLGQGPED
ncbi:MAG: hypothetical protein LQ343_007184 [Gyalolechia ehrenbergii]|nr:MAG: hypothetical protein LQ343_007184 [Gyalolechia ehrenbergii]